MNIEQLKQLDMQRKNGLVLKAISAVGVLALLGILASGAILSPTSMTSLLMLAIQIGIFSFLHYKNKAIFVLPYIAILGSFLSSVLTMVQDPNSTSFLSTFYLLIIATIYMDRKPLLIGFFLGLCINIYVLFFQAEKFNIGQDESTTIMIYYLLISLVIYALLRGSSYLMNDIETAQLETQKLLSQQEDQQKKILSTVSSISDHLGIVTRSGDDSQQSFDQMSIAFREVTEGVGEQADSTAQIASSVQSTNGRLETMIESLEVLSRKANEANEDSLLGRDRIDELNAMISDFKSNINTMSDDVNKLNHAINEAVEMNKAIQEIANSNEFVIIECEY